jgi:hypothetical protein
VSAPPSRDHGKLAAAGAISGPSAEPLSVTHQSGSCEHGSEPSGIVRGGSILAFRAAQELCSVGSCDFGAN